MPIFLAALLLSSPLQAATKYQCALTGNRITEGALAKNFSLELSASIPTYQNELVDLSAGIDKIKLRVTQSYGAERENSVSYWLECDRNSVCHGARHTKSGKKTKDEPLTVDASISPLARLGRREIFLFTRKKDGFYFRFSLYQDKNARPMGLEIDCHG